MFIYFDTFLFLCFTQAPTIATNKPYKAASIDGLARRAEERSNYEPVLTLISPVDPTMKNGRDGHCPSSASNGHSGHDGHRGSNGGGRGGDGSDGERGSRGEHGGEGSAGFHNQNVQVNLWRLSEDTAGIWRSDIGQTATPVSLSSPGFVLIDTKGGLGGKGGRGGAGGT